MDKWVEEFQKKNGRKPTFAEFQAHNAEQKSAATGATPVQQSAESVKPEESAAPQQTQAGQPSTPAQPEKPAKAGQPAQSEQTPTSGQAQQPVQAEEPTQADKPAKGNQTAQSTQQVKADQTVQPTQAAEAVQSTNVNQTVQPSQPTQNASNPQPTKNVENAPQKQNVANAQSRQNAVNNAQPTQNAAGAPQTQSQPANANAQPGPQKNNTEGSTQQQVVPQNAAMAQQNFAQAAQPTAPKKSPKSGSGVKRFFFSPLGIGLTAAVVLLIAFVATGLLTSTSRNSLRNKYDAAVKKDDPKALLALFPKKQTESRFAEIGAKELIKSKKSFAEFEKASAGDEFSITESKHLLFFKSYSLNASTTVIDKGDAPKGSKLSIDDKELDAKDFKTEFFPGTYKVKADVKSEFGKAEFTTEVRAGKKKAVSLEFDIDDRYITLPAGPDSITVAYKDNETDVKLSDKQQKIGPFSNDDDEDAKDPRNYLTLSGEYGGVKIEGAKLSDLEDGYSKRRLKGETILPFRSSDVSFDKKKFDPYIQTFASEWFKAGQKGSTEDLDALKDMISSTEPPVTFENDKDEKNEYKGIEISKYDPYRVYIGLDGSLYVRAEFSIIYNRTDLSKKGSKPVKRSSLQWIIFRLEKDGKMKAVAKESDTF